ncbi:TonB-dependent receptor plug domain-containing protein [Brachyspira hyodysenteriae]|uniref:TonB-dependent receptor plug domain-containing protein n=1 Tax=Brachyspira hyodysenteriae TaxID=159 RepID=UPI0022CDE5B6|nr:TonB-dependent receptor [Brachyspira hyodysenteriae]MDA0022572.1 TonB-dependent receptor plug domain-containing protein [Brachyspira hyodysenteriae]
MKKYIIVLFIFTNLLYSQSYLIRELKGGIWVTSQVEITNASQTNQTNNISAPKTPIKANNRIITSEEIDRMGYKNAQEVLANQPGFINKGNYMGNEVVDPAGANGDNIKIYINGILMNTAKGNADAGVDLRRIPSNLIESIEIIGNSIYITTKSPVQDILLISLCYGAYNTVRPSILFSKNIDEHQVFTFTADSYYSDANYHYDFINSSGDRVQGNFRDNRQFIVNSSANYKYTFDNKDYINVFANISYSSSAAQYQIPPINKTDSWFTFTTLASSISYNGFSDILNYNVTLSYLFDSFGDRPYFQNGKFVSDYKSHAIALNTTLERMDEFLPNTITMYNKLTPEYRYDILTEDTNAIETNFYYYPQRHSISIKYDMQLSFGYWDNNTPIFTLLPSIKYEYQNEIFTNQKNNNYLAYNVGFNLNFYKGYSLYFGYMSDYTSPTFNDLYYGTFSNPKLLPESYNQLLTKLTLEPITNLKIEASYAYTTYTNKIIWLYAVPENVDTATSHIFTSSIGYDIPFAQYHKIKTKIGYSYQLAYMGENQLPKIGLPEHVVTALLGYDFIPKNKVLSSLSLNIYYTYSAPRPLSDYKPIIYSEVFHDFNISFYSIWFNHLIFSMHFKNIFNKTPILSTYSVAKPFTWEFEIGYNF